MGPGRREGPFTPDSFLDTLRSSTSENWFVNDTILLFDCLLAHSTCDVEIPLPLADTDWSMAFEIPRSE